jgi:hypothetical protein
MTDWLVEASDAYSQWVQSQEHPATSQQAVLAWILGLEFTGPPAVVGYSDDGFPLADGPLGLLIEFTVVPKPLAFGNGPPYAIIGVKTIGK